MYILVEIRVEYKKETMLAITDAAVT